MERVKDLVQNGQATQWNLEEATIQYHAAAIADDSYREDYIEKQLAKLKEAKRRSAMSKAERMQQAEEQHVSGQLTGAELEAIR